jgi:hypothetical protein
VKDRIANCLVPLIANADSLAAAVARAFIETPVALYCNEGAREAAPVREQLAVFAARGDGLWLARIHAVLIAIDTILLKERVLETPGACRYAPMLAALGTLKTAERASEAHCLSNARRSPIAFLDKSTLLTAPVSPLRDAGMTAFIDRLLVELSKHTPKKLLLHLEGLDEEDRARFEASLLDDELKALRCRMEKL